MLLRPLFAVLFAVAPSSLMAFDAMDCVATQTCTVNQGCVDEVTTITLDFDWPDDAVTLNRPEAESQRQQIVGNSFDPDAMSGVLSYRGDGQAAALIAFRAGSITLTYAPGDDTSFTASCEAREAA